MATRRRWARALLFLCVMAPELEAGSLSGRVFVAEEKGPPRYYLGPYRGAPTPELRRQHSAGVVVYVHGSFPDANFVAAADRAIVRQRHQRFLPHVLPILKGTTVAFPNLDNYYHNVFSVVAGDRFDLGRFGQGDTRLQVFADPAVVVVRCEIHPGMKAFILVRQNPAFTVPDASGHFQLRDVPAGTWSLVAWHPTRANLRRTVTVTDGKSATLELSF